MNNKCIDDFLMGEFYAMEWGSKICMEFHGKFNVVPTIFS
jgi:hypothetical protein